MGWIMNFRFGFVRKALSSAVLLKLSVLSWFLVCKSVLPQRWEPGRKPLLYLSSLPSFGRDLEAWMTSATALCSSQQFCILLSTSLECRRGEQTEYTPTFLMHIFQYLVWLEAINYMCEMKLAFLGFTVSRNQVKLVQPVDGHGL